MKVEIALNTYKGEVIYRASGYPINVCGVDLVAYHPIYQKNGAPVTSPAWETADPVTGLFVSRNCATRTEAIAVAADRLDRMGGAEGFRKAQAARLAEFAAEAQS